MPSTLPHPKRPQPASWRVWLSLRGWVFVLVGAALVAVAVKFQRSEALVVGLISLIGPLLALLALLAARRRPRYRRQLPSQLAHVGEVMSVQLTPLPWPTRPRNDAVADLTPIGGVAAQPVAWTEPAAASNQAAIATLGYDLPLKRRGLAEIGPAVIVRGDVFGFARRREIVAGQTEVAVAPPPVELVAPHLSHEGREGAVTKINTPRMPDPAQVRDYRSGDPRSLVHWRATARRQHLMVRGDQPRLDPDVWLIIDNIGFQVGPWDQLSPSEQRTERAIAVAAALAQIYLRRGHQVNLLPLGSGQISSFEPDVGTEPVLRWFAALALAEQDDPTWSQALTGILDQTGEPPAALACLAGLTPDRSQALAALRQTCDPALVYFVPVAPDEVTSVDSAESVASTGWTELHLAEQLAGETA